MGKKTAHAQTGLCNNTMTSNQEAVNYMLGFISNTRLHYLLR